MDRRKELKEIYKNIKPDMGVFIIKSNKEKKGYIEATKNLKGSMNRAKFTLDFGSHPNKELQEAWNKDGASSFSIEVLDKLEYDKDESKADYSEELNILRMYCEERLASEGIEFYK